MYFGNYAVFLLFLIFQSSHPKMEVVFLLGSVQAFFLSFLVFNKKGKSHSEIILGTWLALLGLHILYYYLFTTGFLFRYPHLLGITAAFPMLEAPLMYIYVLVTISRKGRFRAVYLLNALPFLIFTIYFSFTFYFLSGPEKISYYEQMYIKLPRDLAIMSFPDIAMGPIYVILSLIALSQHSKNIAQRFSYTEQISLNWLKYVIGGLGFVFFTDVVSNILVKFPFMSVEAHEHLNYLSMTIAVFFLGFFGIRQQAISNVEVASSHTNAMDVSRKKKGRGNQYLHSGLKKEEAEQHAIALKAYFKNEKPYLNGKLSLSEVAEYMEISVNHLSQVINDQLGFSFFDFVNSYRVEEVKAKLADSAYENYTLLGMAYDSGFNSKSTFNSIFKKFTGFTPSQFASRKTD